MTRGAVLALAASPRFDEAAREFLRLCVGLRVGGHEVVLLEIGPGAGLLSADAERPDEAERFLAALAEEGVRPHRAGAAELRDALRACVRLMRVGAASRSGRPPLLLVDDAWIDAADDGALVDALVDAGQVVRVPEAHAPGERAARVRN